MFLTSRSAASGSMAVSVCADHARSLLMKDDSKDDSNALNSQLLISDMVFLDFKVLEFRCLNLGNRCRSMDSSYIPLMKLYRTMPERDYSQVLPDCETSTIIYCVDFFFLVTEVLALVLTLAGCHEFR